MINSISEITQLWDRALRKIDERLGERQIFDSFFANSYINNVQDNTIVVVVSTALARTLLKTKYYDLVSGVINEITESNYRLDFILEGEAKSEKIDYTASQPKKQQQFFQDAILNTKLTFDNFVVGEFNKAYAYCCFLNIEKEEENINKCSIHFKEEIDNENVYDTINFLKYVNTHYEDEEVKIKSLDCNCNYLKINFFIETLFFLIIEILFN
jgi:hypothetical protein